MEAARADLALRWSRQAEPAGLPAFSTLPDPPEPTLAEYVQQFERLLGLWSEKWAQTEPLLYALGLNWPAFRADEIARSTPSVPVRERSAHRRAAPCAPPSTSGCRGSAGWTPCASSRPWPSGWAAGSWGSARRSARRSTSWTPTPTSASTAGSRTCGARPPCSSGGASCCAKVAQTAPQWAAAVERRRGHPRRAHRARAIWPPPGAGASSSRSSTGGPSWTTARLAGRLEAKQQQLREVTIELVDHSRLAGPAAAHRSGGAAGAHRLGRHPAQDRQGDRQAGPRPAAQGARAADPGARGGAGLDHAAGPGGRELRRPPRQVRRGHRRRGQPVRPAGPAGPVAGPGRGHRRRPRAGQPLGHRRDGGGHPGPHQPVPGRHPQQPPLRRPDLGLRPGPPVVRRHHRPARALPLRPRHHRVLQPALVQRRDPPPARPQRRPPPPPRRVPGPAAARARPARARSTTPRPRWSPPWPPPP